MDTTARNEDRLIEPRDAAKLFGVTSKTVGRWRKKGLISGQETMGGRFRYWESEMRAHAAKRAVA